MHCSKLINVFSDDSKVDCVGVDGSAWYRAQLIIDMMGGDLSLLHNMFNHHVDEQCCDVGK